MLKSNMIKKILPMIITISLLLSMSTTSFANSETNLQTNQQEFIEEIKSKSGTSIQITPNSTMQNMEYTYVDNGKTYKVLEKANEDLTYVESKVYIKDSIGDYTLEYSTITEVGKDTVAVTKHENGIETRNNINLNQIKEISKEYENTQNIKSSQVPPISSWELHHKLNYSYRIYTYTLVAVTAVISGVAAAAGGAYISGLASVVSYIIDDHIPRVWYTQYSHCKWRKWPTLWEIVAERTVTYHYANSTRTDYIGLTSSEHWVK